MRIFRSFLSVALRCFSLNCDAAGKCAEPADTPKQPKSWVYAIVAVFIVLSKRLSFSLRFYSPIYSMTIKQTRLTSLPTLFPPLLQSSLVS
jgi:hypothetical protein